MKLGWFQMNIMQIINYFTYSFYGQNMSVYEKSDSWVLEKSNDRRKRERKKEEERNRERPK